MPNIRQALEFSLSEDGRHSRLSLPYNPFGCAGECCGRRANGRTTRRRVHRGSRPAIVRKPSSAPRWWRRCTVTYRWARLGQRRREPSHFKGAAAHLKDALRASKDDTLRPRRLPVARGADFVRLSSRYCRGSTRRESWQNLARMPAKGSSVTGKSIFTLLLSSGGSIDLGSSSVSPAQGTGVRGRVDQGPSASPSGRGRRPR